MRADASDENGEAVKTLARMLVEQHHEYILADMLTGPRPAVFAEGARLLAQAIVQDNSGDRDAGFETATQAVAAFRRSGNHSGELRARHEALYALSRAGRSADCLEYSATLLPSLPASRYPWARIQALLARSTCLIRLGDLNASLLLIRESKRVADDAKLQILTLRVMSFIAGFTRAVGDFQTAANQDLDGLRTYWSGIYPPLRVYQFYSELADIAEPRGNVHASYLIWKESVPLIAESGIRTTEAAARHRLAALSGLTGRVAESEAEWERADAILNELGRAESIKGYRAVGGLEMAEQHLRLGQTALARNALDRVRIEDLDGSIQYQADFHATRGAVALQQNRKAEALQDYRSAFTLSEAALETVKTQRERATWAKDAGPVYRQLIRLTLEVDKNSERALGIWEKYRSSTVAPGSPEGDGLDAFRGFTRTLKDTSILSFVQFDDDLAGWLFDDRGITPFRVALSREQARQMCSGFLSLVSRPESSLDQVRKSGQEVYAKLIRPIEERLDENRMIAVEPDGPCAGIAFEALADAQGRYLGERFRVVTSPGAFVPQNWSPTRYKVEPSLHALIVGDPRLTGDLATIYPELPEARKEAEVVASFFSSNKRLTSTRATLAEIRQTMPSAQVFHFAGHGVSTSQNGTLLLAPSDPASGAALLDSTEFDSALQRAHLVVLSACYTGVGERLGPFNPDSLVQGLWRAGVPNVVATRWAVDTRAALRIVSAFYREINSGRSPAAAMQTAAAELRRSPGFAHPAMWAPFHVFGSPILNP